jgi:hypothetical protein
MNYGEISSKDLCFKYAIIKLSSKISVLQLVEYVDKVWIMLKKLAYICQQV